MVSDPSTPGAFMMSESKQPSNIFTEEDKIRRSLKEKIKVLRKSDTELQKLKKRVNANRDDVLSLLE